MTRYRDDYREEPADKVFQAIVIVDKLTVVGRRETANPFTFTRTSDEIVVTLKAGARVEVRKPLYWVIHRVPGYWDYRFDLTYLHPHSIRLLGPLELLADQAE